MYTFVLNGRCWKIIFVHPNSPMLVDRTGQLTLGTTDSRTSTLYLSGALRGDLLVRVLVHEIGHAVMVSYNLISDIHKVVMPEYWIDAEEWLCNFMMDYGVYIFDAMYQILGYSAWKHVPIALEQLVL